MGLFKRKSNKSDQNDNSASDLVASSSEENIRQNMGFFERIMFGFRRYTIYGRILMIGSLLSIAIISFTTGNIAGLKTDAEIGREATPAGTNVAWTNSNTSATIEQPVYNSSTQTMAIPITVDDMTALPNDAKNYSLRLLSAGGSQLTDVKAKFILYGNSGSGVIVLQGKDVGKLPIRILLINNKIVSQRLDSNGNVVHGTFTINNSSQQVKTDLIPMVVYGKKAEKSANLDYSDSNTTILQDGLTNTFEEKIDDQLKQANTELKVAQNRLKEAQTQLNSQTNHDNVIANAQNGNQSAATSSSDSDASSDTAAQNADKLGQYQQAVTDAQTKITNLKEFRTQLGQGVTALGKEATVSYNYKVVG